MRRHGQTPKYGEKGIFAMKAAIKDGLNWFEVMSEILRLVESLKVYVGEITPSYLAYFEPLLIDGINNLKDAIYALNDCPPPGDIEYACENYETGGYIKRVVGEPKVSARMEYNSLIFHEYSLEEREVIKKHNADPINNPPLVFPDIPDLAQIEEAKAAS